MKSITKKELIENALSKFTDIEISQAKGFGWTAIFKDGLKTGTENSNFVWNQKDRREAIRKDIRGALKNTTPNNENKRLNNNTSSDNILKINIRLKKD